MHHLFRIFDAYKGEFHTVTTTVTDENGNQIEKETVAISFDMLNGFMKEWKSVYEKSASPDPEVSEKVTMIIMFIISLKVQMWIRLTRIC